MDINELREIFKESAKNEAMAQQIRDKFERHDNNVQERQYETREYFQPVITAQEDVKKTINEKQDKVIEQLDKNQTELIQSVDVLSDIMSKQGSTAGVERWVSDLPSRFEPIEEEGGDDKSIFSNDEKEVIKKYNFDPTLKNIPAERDVRSKISSTNGKMRNKDQVISRIAEKERDVLKKYLVAVKTAKQKNGGEEHTGSGIRRYNQTKRNAYKVSQDDMYGGLFINKPRLLNEMVIEAHRGGQIVYENKGDKSLVDLLTKRFNPKKRYSSKAIQIFNDLNMLSGIQKHKSSAKVNLTGGMIYYTKPKELTDRLRLLTGSRRAGNTNFQLRNEVWEIIDKLLSLGFMTKTEHDAYVKKYLV